MPKLAELMKRFCPEEVHHRRLSDVAKYVRERVHFAKVTVDNHVGIDNMLQDKRGVTKSDHVPSYGTLTAYTEGDVLIGSIRTYLKKI